MPAELHVVLAPVEVDMGTSDQLAKALAAVDPSADLVVDCSQLRFIDSSGLRVLVVAHEERTRSGGTLRVAQAPDSMLRLLEITNLQHLLGDA